MSVGTLRLENQWKRASPRCSAIKPIVIINAFHAVKLLNLKNNFLMQIAKAMIHFKIDKNRKIGLIILHKFYPNICVLIVNMLKRKGTSPT